MNATYTTTMTHMPIVNVCTVAESDPRGMRDFIRATLTPNATAVQPQTFNVSGRRPWTPEEIAADDEEILILYAAYEMLNEDA
jgi:hypothetical protein